MAAARGADGNSLAARGADGNNLAATGATCQNLDVSGLPAASSHEHAGGIIARKEEAEYEIRILREYADLEALVDDHPARRPATVNAARTTTTATEHAQQTQNLQLPQLCSEWSPILSFVGDHILCADLDLWEWGCTACKPSWHNWACHQCRESVPLAWTVDGHWGAWHCGQSCPCCRHAVGEYFGVCEECEAFSVLNSVSRDMRRTLRSWERWRLWGEGGASSWR
jgi:hypothetical protein